MHPNDVDGHQTGAGLHRSVVNPQEGVARCSGPVQANNGSVPAGPAWRARIRQTGSLNRSLGRAGRGAQPSAWLPQGHRDFVVCRTATGSGRALLAASQLPAQRNVKKFTAAPDSGTVRKRARRAPPGSDRGGASRLSGSSCRRRPLRRRRGHRPRCGRCRRAPPSRAECRCRSARRRSARRVGAGWRRTAARRVAGCR